MTEHFVNMWEEDVLIPTYETGEPEKNPMFFEKRVYQGSSGSVYPYPVIEKIYDERINKTYRAVFLENAYLKIMILPALGGRVQMAFDKIAGRHFIYHNEVIKPALVGLCGPWISGGIEFNWPQHHRPSTFEAVDHTLEAHGDGSKTVWINEVERMNHTKGLAGFTLHPDRAYLEVHAKLFNRTPFPQTFLWWANPALKANGAYQSVFPPDVNAVVDHGRRDASTFPIAHGTYYKVDYSPGTDISRYHNIPVPTSYMADRSAYDFVGGYNHDEEAGFLHVADHHISPGKKQWTWGTSEFGQAWERNLTDANGPYVELMAGVYTDNQPDFAWMMPFEQKTFTQYFMPYRKLGMIMKASKDLLLHFSVKDGMATLKLAANCNIPRLCITVSDIFSQKIGLSTGSIFEARFPAAGVLDVRLEADAFVMEYQHRESLPTVRATPATAPLPPAEIGNVEELFLTGMHLEQYRHATVSPLLYYKEAMHREPGDIRVNNALGLWYLRRGRFTTAESYFRTALSTLTRRNANPYDGEVHHNLGISLFYQDKLDDAYDALYKSTWSGAHQSAAFLSLARIDMRRGDHRRAIQHAAQCLSLNSGNSKARAILAIAQKKSGDAAAATSTIQQGLAMDLFNVSLYIESDDLAKAAMLCRYNHNNFITYAIDYSELGLYQQSIQWLQLIGNSPNPLVHYYTGWNYLRLGLEQQALQAFAKAASLPAGGCFPNRLEDIIVLRAAIGQQPNDHNAQYLLGCLWYDKRQYRRAMDCWTKALDADSPQVHRNLGIGYYNKTHNREKALLHYEKAFNLNKSDARILMELDQLYKRCNHPLEARLRLLNANAETVTSRDDLYLEHTILRNLTGHYQQALQLLLSRRFHPWEGGEGKVSAQYRHSLLGLARECLFNKDFETAISYLQEISSLPINLGEGRLTNQPDNEVQFWLGFALEGIGDEASARSCYQLGASGNSRPAPAIFYNDPQPDEIFYRGLSWHRLKDPERGDSLFRNMVEYGKHHEHDEVRIDYFAVSLPDLMIFDDDLDKRNLIHCKYMMALGRLGLGETSAAFSLLNNILELDCSHQGAIAHLQVLSLLTAREVESV